MLALQRGLIAIGQNQNRESFIVRSLVKVVVVAIPAKAGIQLRNTEFRVKPGMTIKVKGLLTQYNNEWRNLK